MSVLIIPYRSGSESARALAEALGVRRVRLPTRDRWARRRAAPTFINWGNTEIWHKKYSVLNNCGAVQRARDKLHTLRVLQEHNVPTVEWTTDPLVAAEWGENIFCRHSLTGQGGAGIEIAAAFYGTLPPAPLYTRYFKAKHEYRVHVVDGVVIDEQKKRRRNGAERALVRNLANGYVYCRENVVLPNSVVDAAINAIAALGLDFGAVDILCKERGECAVLEVNTAPGLEGSTVQHYAEALRRLIENQA